MEIDVLVKKARAYAQPIEVVSIDEDDEGSINKGKGTIVEEEKNDQSQTVSKPKRSSSHLSLIESSKEPTMMIQKFTLDQVESSHFHSKEDLVKDFTKERNKSINESYKLMQEVRKTSLVGTSLLTVREANNNVVRIATEDQEQVSQVRIQIDKIGIPNKINFHKQATEILYSDLLKS